MLLAACAQVSPAPTPTAPATPTLTPTAAAAPTLTPTPPPTDIAVPVPQAIEFQSEPGIPVPGQFFPAAQPGAPVLVLMHGGGGRGQNWVDAGLVAWLRGQAVPGSVRSGVAAWRPLGTSYNVLIFDYRGDWVKAGLAAVEKAKALAGVDDHRVAAIGASAGADGAVQACAAAGCAGVLALSPTGSISGEPFASVEARLEAKSQAPVWCLATDGDGGCPRGGGPAYQAWVHAGLAHGMGMLGVPDTEARVRGFLQTVFPDSAPKP